MNITQTNILWCWILLLPFFGCYYPEERSTFLNSKQDNQAHVRFERDLQGNWQLMRNGESYFVKGGHGNVRMDWLKEIGGNSILIYHNQLTVPQMDLADSLGLSVSIVLDILKPRFGHSYKNKALIRKQRDELIQVVDKYRNHPALLFWIIGNETHVLKRNNLALWREVNRIAKIIHQLDSHHPITTSIAAYPTKTFDLVQIKLLAPELDFISLTVYEFAPRIKREMGNFLWGSQKPYLVTEWGGVPFWMLEKTDWGAVIEPNTTEKAAYFIHNYHVAIEYNKKQCVGGYVFYWGQKQERTHTMFSLILGDSLKTQAMESVRYSWGGQEPDNSCPRIEYARPEDLLPGQQAYLKMDTEYSFMVKVADPDLDTITMRFEVLREGDYYQKWGGEEEARPEVIFRSKTFPYTESFRFRTPAWQDPFRLFVYFFDGKENVAVANIPFYTYP